MLYASHDQESVVVEMFAFFVAFSSSRTTLFLPPSMEGFMQCI